MSQRAVMFFDLDLRGDALSPRTLCLTYDDGPGPRTAELGDYLAGQGIAATFFLIGSHARAYPEIVARLKAGGHLVGNHTETHPPLVAFARDGGDVEGELAQTDLAIGLGGVTYFRPPYGDWREGSSPSSSVAARLNASGRFPHLVGPVGWDIDCADWRFWKLGRTAEECGQGYLEAIEGTGRGIVLLHDGAETEAMRRGNRCFEMTRRLVPILQGRGYRFVRLDEVPGIASASLVTRQVTLRTQADRRLTCPEGSRRITLTPSRHQSGGRERFGIVACEPSSRGEVIALRAWNGRYLAAHPSGEVVADSIAIDDSTRWHLQPAPLGSFRINLARGGTLTLGDDLESIRLEADPPSPLGFEIQHVAETGPIPGASRQKGD